MGSVADKLMDLEPLEHPSPEDIIQRKNALDAIRKQWCRVDSRILSEYRMMQDACPHYVEEQKEDPNCFIVMIPKCAYCEMIVDGQDKNLKEAFVD